ncbi:MAG TPA: hypothetical protein VGD33_11615, partial [Chitinophagaceae bacterium]
MQTIIIYESKGIYMNYEYYTRHHKQLVTEVDYFLHPAQLELVHEMQKGPEAFFTKSFSGEEVQNWFEYQKTTPQFLDSYLATATSINWYFYSVGPIGLGISTYAPLNNEEVLLFKRFRNVFELAYRRYLDIEKAEAQTREAQVEAALERVRSHTMAMHSSTDLLQVIKVVGDQLQQLGFPADAVSFITDNTEKGYNMWLASPGDVFLSKVYIPRIDDRTTRMYKEAVEKGEDYYTYLLTKEEKDRYFRNFFENTDLKVTPEEVKQQIFETPGMAAAIAVMDTIILSVTNFRPTPYIEQHNDILKRFAFVFQQSYVRFLDLQKAEAQARDAQIEAALERVRAKVMAMNSSKDLNDASLVFGEQLRALGIHWMFSYFWLIEEGKNENTFWITWPDKKTSTTTYSLAEADESFRECIVAWRRQDKIHATYVPVQDVQAWLDTFERVTLDAGGEAVEVMKADNFKNGVYYYDAMIKFGSFGILINRPINEEEKNIQSRFAV